MFDETDGGTTMARIWERLAALLALGIGVMALFAGLPVILGRNPGYFVIGWLPWYNAIAGASTVATALVLWFGQRWDRLLTGLTFAAHAVVLLILMTAYRDVVAPDSVRAMLIRLGVWLVIVALLVVQARRSRSRQPAPAEAEPVRLKS